ncbi:MAG: DUF3853 family protein [Candidatus Azobacteroides sp.]|nr:DUF3853 family protein [Candidatus Azobacteroides sp.]
MNRDLNTPVWQLTAGELIDFLVESMRPEQPVKPDFEPVDKYVYGISGIAELLGVSKTMVHEYRKKGWIEPAIKQLGRKIVCDAPLALELFGKRNFQVNKQ